jgi:hypothetical protein
MTGNCHVRFLEGRASVMRSGYSINRRLDEILAWEQRKETERDTKFVELGRYLCEVREGQPGQW